MRFRGFATLMLAGLILLIAALRMHPHRVVLSGARTWTITIPARTAPVSPPTLTAKSAFLADAVSGQELFSLNPDLELPNASTTKIVTATIALQHGDPDRTVTASRKAADTEPANIAMKPGETFTLRDLLYAMMIHSANDAAVSVAEAVGGTEAAFVAQMNDEACRLHCTHTHFVTPNGLQDPKHYTTARDLCKFTTYALRLPLFNELIRTRHYKIARSVNKKVLMMHRSHGDRFLFKYPGADGVKTGYTHPAGRCYVGSATHKDALGNWRLVSVVLHAKDTFRDTSAMMDYGFKAWERVAVVQKGEVVGALASSPRGAVVSIQAASPVTAVLRADQPHTVTLQYRVSAPIPIAAGSRVGRLELSIDGQKAQRVWLTPVQSDAAAPGWKRLQEARFSMCTLAILVVGCGYGSFAKANRRRRLLLAARSGRLDPPGPGYAQWQNGRDRAERGPRR